MVFGEWRVCCLDGGVKEMCIHKLVKYLALKHMQLFFNVTFRIKMPWKGIKIYSSMFELVYRGI